MMTEKAALPLPDIDNPLTAPFWAAAQDHRLVMQHCPSCGAIAWPPKTSCPDCLCGFTEDAWKEIAATGTIWSFVVYHRAFHPGFADRIPYNVAYVKLDAGPMFITNISQGTSCRIGERVRAAFVSATPEVTLIEFKKIE